MLLFFLIYLTPFSADRVEIIKENGESIVHLIGNVAIQDTNTQITCFEAKFNESKGVVVLVRDVKIVDKNGTINANSAVYYFSEKIGYLSGNVSLITDQQTISSDSLYYNGRNEYVEMFNNVRIEDPKNNLVAYSKKGWYDLAKEQGHLIDNPKLEISRENKEPIKIMAREFQLITQENILYGFDSVVAFIDSITISCDTLSYNTKTEEGSLIKPVITEKTNELTGESGKFQLRNKEIDSFSVENGWSRYYTKAGSKNEVTGLKISIIFKKGKAAKILVEGQPTGTLTLKREAKK